MGFVPFRRSHKEETSKGPKIEEVEEDDHRTPSSSTQPIIEEPDEQGNYPGNSTQCNPRSQHPQYQDQGFDDGDFSPYDSFFSNRASMQESVRPFGHDPFETHFRGMHSQMQQMMRGSDSFFGPFLGPSMFGPDPFLGSPMAMLQGPMQSGGLGGFGGFPNADNQARSQGRPGADQFAYEFQSYSSLGNGSGQRTERHFSARGSTDDNQHHVNESVRGGDGRIRSRQESIPFGRRSTRDSQQQIGYRDE